ncbi:gamma-butyrobetaine hydroxylase-like domain-containing protein [Comamonas granuli]|uniref:gamma-butyrobetaine hydroxylase-like domain-containing protein n=1 Tax=Comamonas granuli TaxID=290309 RepID=UPI0005AACD18|nr:DUF971 domain-containing protein [Comamonas granuli]
MAGLVPGAPTPRSITVHGQSRTLELVFSDGAHFRIPFELLRVYSPSAEVMGHGPGQEVLQTGKRAVEIEDIAAIGNYAIQPRFSDGHDSGIYSWDYLYDLGQRQDALWQRYLQRLQDAGLERDAPMPGAHAGGAPAQGFSLTRSKPEGGGCGSGGCGCQ